MSFRRQDTVQHTTLSSHNTARLGLTITNLAYLSFFKQSVDQWYDAGRDVIRVFQSTELFFRVGVMARMIRKGPDDLSRTFLLAEISFKQFPAILSVLRKSARRLYPRESTILNITFYAPKKQNLGDL